MRRFWTRGLRGGRVARAFFDMGFSTAINYPLDFFMSALRPLVPVVTFFFVAQLVSDTDSVGSDYYSFVILGFLVTEALQGALAGFTREVQIAIQQGRFEMLLVEPVPWMLLPFGLAVWPVILRIALAGFAGLVATFFGADFQFSGLAMAILLLTLGTGASLSIGVFSGSIGVLSKRSDPVLTVYTIVAGILSGVAFPIDLLPAPVRAASWLIPHTYVITGIRKLLLPNGADISGPTVFQSTIALSVFMVLGFPLALWSYHQIMEAGRRTGVLSGY